MYKLLIVEDEVIFRNVLPQIIDWNSIGFEVAAVVENGYKALEVLDKVLPDVILTDIRMPVLNGLELAMEVKLRYPGIKVLLLSAFNEFDYARRGIDCGVYGYILKSDGEDEIVRYFTKLKKVLDEESLDSAASNEIWIQREALFRRLLSDKAEISKSDLLEARRLLFADSHEIRIVLFHLDEYQYTVFSSGNDKAQSINHMIRDFLYRHIEMQGKGTVLSIDDRVCVAWNILDNTFQTFLIETFSRLSEELDLLKGNAEEDITVSCSVSSTVSAIEEVHSAYDNAGKALIHAAYMDGGCIIYYDQLPENPGVLTFTEEERLLKEILPLFHNRDTENMIKYLSNLQEDFISKKITDIDMVSGFAVKLVLALAGDMGKMGIKSDSFLMKSNYIIKEMGYFKTIRSIFSKLESFLIEAFVLINEDNNIQNRKIVDEAVLYIQKKYSEQIGLDEVARYVNVHPVHLSRLFSRDLGETFKRVLTETRIEQAKRLLRDINYKVYEISSLVGYEKPRYFSELFRSMTGLTPLEYREKYKA